MGKADMFLTKEIADYVTRNGLYGDYCYVNGLYARFGMKRSRIEHSFSAALCGVGLAKRLCVDTHKATTALLLHDIGKYVTKEDAEKLGVRFDGRIDCMPLPVRHAEIGAELLRQVIGIEDDDIIEAVRWHTTGRAAMTPIEKVVYLADYIEPLPRFSGRGRTARGNGKKRRRRTARRSPQFRRTCRERRSVPRDGGGIRILQGEKMKTVTKEQAHELAEKIAAVIDEKKGRDIVIIDISEKSVLADYFVIASGRSTTAVRSLCDNVEEKLSKEGIEPVRRDGMNETKWIVMDYGSVILHVFHEETASITDSNRLWVDGANCERYGE